MLGQRIIFGLMAIAAASALPLQSSFAAEAKRFPCGVGMVQNGPLLHHAGLRAIDVPAGHVRLNYVGHSTFLIESPQGIKVATDYNHNYVPSVLPNIATMNIQRGNHSRAEVDPKVKYVLRGWDTGSGISRHDIRQKDVRVYNIPTNITDYGSGLTNDSSIFVIEAAGVCIGHMGHLRHVLDRERVARLGRIDVLLLPVDRRVTQSMDELLANIAAISPRLIIPMHFNSMYTVNEFVAQVGSRYPVKRRKRNVLEIARANLPPRTEIWVLPPNFLSDFGGSPI